MASDTNAGNYDDLTIRFPIGVVGLPWQRVMHKPEAGERTLTDVDLRYMFDRDNISPANMTRMNLVVKALNNAASGFKVNCEFTNEEKKD